MPRNASLRTGELAYVALPEPGAQGNSRLTVQDEPSREYLNLS